MSWWCRYHVWRSECQRQAGLAWCGSYHWLEIDWIPWDSIPQIAPIYGVWQCPSWRFRGEKRVRIFVRLPWKQVWKVTCLGQLWGWTPYFLQTIILVSLPQCSLSRPSCAREIAEIVVCIIEFLKATLLLLSWSSHHKISFYVTVYETNL